MNNESIIESRKYYKRNKMLSMIRFHENVSRYDVKKHTSYSMPTVLSTIEEMIQEGLIYEEECDEPRVGRKPVWLRVNPKGGYFVGLEFNGRTMHCVMLDFTGVKIFESQSSIFNSDTAEGILSKLKEHIKTAIDTLGDRKNRVVGIGIGSPGYVDKKRGWALGYGHLKSWKDIPLKSIMEETFQIPCYIENNVNVMASAYKWLVYQGKCEDFLFISIRTGARVVPIINNQLVSSDFGYPGELGHIKVGSGGHMCSCGKMGCLNSEVSDYSIVSRILEGIRVGRFGETLELVNGEEDRITMQTFVESVQLGHKDALELMKVVVEYLGRAIGILVNIFAPRRIVLYGELARIGEVFLDPLRRRIHEDIIKENEPYLEIMASTFGLDLGAMGAAALVMQEEYEIIEQTI